jgi:hypothetical protein
MYTLQNDYLKAIFDDKARITWLENLKDGTGNIIEKITPDAFLLNFKKKENWENPAFGGKQDFCVEQKDNTLVYSIKTLRTKDGESTISLLLTITLAGEDLLFDSKIDNEEPDTLVTDFEYPKLGVIKTFAGKEPSLYAPMQAGVRVDKIGAFLSSKGISRESNPYSYEINYPGCSGSMHWMALEASGQTLYAACQDPDFYASQMRVDGSIEDKNALTLVFEIMPFVKRDEIWEAPRTHIKLYKGSWHKGADEYRLWSKSWRVPHEKPEWIKNLVGMFLVINKQQFGDEMWPYDTLPKLYDLAKAHGCENLSLFGWYDSGHDNQYPDLEASNSLGGKEVLKENIKKVQDAGGKVTLYQQGHLIDTTTAWYRNGGYRYESRTRSNTPYFEYYNKSHRSMFLKYYTSKYFSISCPSCPEWRELMVEKTDFIAGFKADGVLFDQIGGMWAYPCFNEKHPHEKGKPSLSMTAGRRKLLDAIQKRTKEHNKEYAFFSEHVTDLYSTWLDCLHSCSTLPSEEGAYLNRETPGVVNDPALFRYCFPETKMTIRNANPFIEKRSANFAFAFGLVFEMEIRYDQDKEDILADKWPEERQYAEKVNNLRKKYLDTLVRGNFADNRPLLDYNPEIITKAFESEGKVAVTLWNDSDTAKSINLSVQKGTFAEYATIDGTAKALPASIPARSIGLALFNIN